MARKKQTKDPVRGDAHVILTREADRLASAHAINSQRARRILERMVSILPSEQIDNPVTLEKLLAKRPFSLFAEALKYLPPQQATALFKTDDLATLARRVSAAEYLAKPSVPLYSLAELGDRTDHFLDFLEEQRDNLLAGGCPSEAFVECPYLNHFLGHLYADAGADLTQAGTKLTNAAAELHQVHRLRPTMLDLKVTILRQLRDAARKGMAARLWENCLRSLTETLLANDAEGYLRVDSLYRRAASEDFEGQATTGMVPPGGLSNLLEVIGHFEKELTVGTLTRMRETLGEPLMCALRGADRRDDRCVYFRLVGRPDRETLDAALDTLFGLGVEEKTFWSVYRQRVNDALQSEFKEEIMGRKVKRKFASDFQLMVGTFADFVSNHLEATGDIPRLSLTSAVSPVVRPDAEDAGPQYEFRREKTLWTIRYMEEGGALRDSVGLYYIAYLLSRPGRAIPVSELRAAHTSRAVGAGTPLRRAAGPAGASANEQQASRPGGLGPQFDAAAKADYGRRYRELQAELDEAERNSDIGRVERLQEDIHRLSDEFISGAGLGGRIKERSTQAKKDRDAVCNAIDRAMKVITDQFPALSRHLNNSLKVSPLCSCTPEQPISWIV